MNLVRPSTVLAAFLLASCSHSSSSDSTHVPENAPRALSTCTAPGLENAHRLTVFTLPSGCSWLAGSDRVITDATQLAEVLHCEGAAPPTFDFATSELHVVEYTMSPAFSGIEPFDDGTTVTLLTRFRQPCPGDPMPMPMNATFAFAQPRDPPRTQREATCTRPLSCP